MFLLCFFFVSLFLFGHSPSLWRQCPSPYTPIMDGDSAFVLVQPNRVSSAKHQRGLRAVKAGLHVISALARIKRRSGVFQTMGGGGGAAPAAATEHTVASNVDRARKGIRRSNRHSVTLRRSSIITGPSMPLV